MDTLRENPLKEIAGLKVTAVSDYKTSKTTFTDGGEEIIELPKSNVLAFSLEKGNKVIVRPSGTEPKIKAYITAVGESKEAAEALAEKLKKAADGFMK